MKAQITESNGASRLEAAAVLLLAAAWGWNGGNFSQPNLSLGTQIIVTALHYVPCALVVGAGAVLVTAPWRAWTRPALSIVAAIGLVAVAVITVIGISNPDPNSFGPHNFADYVPVFLIVTGIGTWFVSQVMRRSRP